MTRIATPPTAAAAPLADAPPARQTIRYYADLVHALLSKDLKARYKNTMLGYAWSILHPLAFAMVFFVVCKFVMRIDVPDYPLFLITGLFPWQWLQNSLCASNHYFLGNASLIKKVRFPRFLLVLSGVMNDLIHFLLSIPIIVAFMLYYHHTPGLKWLWMLPLLVVLQWALVFGLSLIIATLNLFFRDLERLTTIFTMLWFYVTPVLYPADMLREYRWTIYVNPAAPLSICWRGLFSAESLQPAFLAIAAGWAVLAVLLGYAVYRRLQWRFAELV